MDPSAETNVSVTTTSRYPAADAVSMIEWTGERGNIEHERLRAALLDAERRMLGAKSRKQDVLGCDRCLRIAQEEANAQRFFGAWDTLHQFDVEYLATLDEEGRRLVGCELAAEANEKLAGWRGKAVKIMEELAGGTPQHSPQWLAAVRAQLAAQSQNSALKREMLRRRVPITLFASLATIGFFLTTAALGWYESLVPGVSGALQLGVLAAALGGVISVAISIGTTNQQAKIPQLGFTLAVTTLRPAVGALCAIPVVFMVYSGFLKFGGLTEAWTSVVLCLVTGFSERWFLTLMERVTAGAKG